MIILIITGGSYLNENQNISQLSDQFSGNQTSVWESTREKIDQYLPKSRDAALSSDIIDTKKIRVIDGDTFQDITTEITYRLYMIDTPETCLFKKKVQGERNADGTCVSKSKEEKNGKEAAQYLHTIFSQAETITIEYDVTKPDKYGRVLVWCFVNDKYLVQAMIAHAGYVDGYYNQNGKFTQDASKIKLFPDYVHLVEQQRKIDKEG